MTRRQPVRQRRTRWQTQTLRGRTGRLDAETARLLLERFLFVLPFPVATSERSGNTSDIDDEHLFMPEDYPHSDLYWSERNTCHASAL